MKQENFVDAISAVHLTGNLVRLDLMTVQPHLQSENGQPVMEVNQRLIMPLDGFVQSLAVQEELLEAGVLKATPSGGSLSEALQEGESA